jgi:hypothetical protein
LEISDFSASADVTAAADLAKSGEWYIDDLAFEALPFVNPLGKTQFRLGFARATDGNASTDYLGFYSGDSETERQPFIRLRYQLGAKVNVLSIAAVDGYIVQSPFTSEQMISAIGQVKPIRH